MGLVGGAKNLEDNEAKRRQVIGRQRRHRGRGLSFLAGDVVDKFTKVAISKLKVSSKEQVCVALGWVEPWNYLQVLIQS